MSARSFADLVKMAQALGVDRHDKPWIVPMNCYADAALRHAATAKMSPIVG
jgi:hypothetical protein